MTRFSRICKKLKNLFTRPQADGSNRRMGRLYRSLEAIQVGNLLPCNHVKVAHIALQYFGNTDIALLILIVFHNRHQRTPNRQTRSV